MGELCFNCFQEKQNPGICEHCGFDPSRQKELYPLVLPFNTILNGRYIIGRVLGQGGFGVTYIAQDFQTKERFAIKEYFPSDLSTRSGSYRVTPYSGQREQDFEFGKKRFLDEAKILAEFNNNSNIVKIYRYFEEESTQTAYFVMEYVDGVSLESYVKAKGGRLSPEEANQILLPLMYSLDEVHKKGVVHRDIAPDNILLNADLSPKLIDFGAARFSTGNKSMSIDVVVKHGFAPKEQYSRHGRVGPYTDVYSMGATWYYAITGRVPPESIDRVEEDSLILPGRLGVRLTEKQLSALLKALAVRAEDRYQSMAEFAADLGQENTDHTTRENLVVRAFEYLEEGNWPKADSYLNTAMDFEPQNAMIYVGRLMAQRHIRTQDELSTAEPFDQEPLYQTALRYADPDLKLKLETWTAAARMNAEHARIGSLMLEGMAAIRKGKWAAADETFNTILQIEPQHAQAHVGKLLAKNRVKEIGQLVKAKEPLSGDIHFAAALSGCDPETRERLIAARDGQNRPKKKWLFPLAALAVAAAAAAIFFYFKPPEPPVQSAALPASAAPILVMPTPDTAGPPTQGQPGVEEGTADKGASQEESPAPATPTPTPEPTPTPTPKPTPTPEPTPTIPSITIRPADISKIYDGKTLSSGEYIIEGNLNGFQVKDVVIDGGQTDVGTGKSRIVSYSLYDPKGNRVSDAEIANSGHVATGDGDLIVKPRPVTITAVSAELTTEGESIQAAALSENGFTNGYKVEGLVRDQQIQGDFIVGSGTETFESRIDASKVRIVDENGSDVTACYSIVPVSGTVSIKLETLTIKISDDCAKLTAKYRAAEEYDMITFAIWSEENGQDDIRWYDSAMIGNNVWELVLDLSKHRSAGIYHVHAYGKKDGEQTLLETKDVEVAKATIPETRVVAERIDDNTARMTLKTKDKYEVVRFAVWSSRDGQDDLMWYSAEKNKSGEWTATFDLSDHPGHTFNIHVYAAKVKGIKEAFVDGITRYWA